jgi:antitoxin component YwqK of YwqJK toxin-antitoxin module|tara:strand:+ start:94 stop:378 length:285 start_codon:yes stop_codon:yes gene_type:complete
MRDKNAFGGNKFHRHKVQDGKIILWEIWSEKGLLEAILTMTDGVPNGPSKRYKDGFLLFEGNLKDGKEDGLWKFFNEDGTLKDTKTYKDGVLLK